MSSTREQIWRQHLAEMRLKVWEDGRAASESGKSLDANPHAAGIFEQFQWIAGYHGCDEFDEFGNRPILN